ncbi:MAG TPA: transcription termination factor NusA [Bacillota bacterium]
MNHEFLDALEQVEREKGVSKEILLDAIETALASAYKRDQKVAQSIEVRIDPDTGEFHVFTHKTVVEEVEDDKNEINLADAQRINPVFELGDLVEFEIFPKEFGRIAAQTAKQVVVQRIREAERSIIYDEFVNRVGDLITGIVQRFEQRNIFIDLGRIEGILPGNEQMPNEHYEPGTRLKTYVVEVKKTTKGPQVLLSRTRTGLLKRLFELEVPEIQDGLVEIKSVAREPGFRSKVAVVSRDAQIDPVGACVGARGIRVQMIVRELKGEKIDVIPWSSEPIEFIVNALSPAKVSEVKILPSKKIAIVIVPDFQLSLAIGKEGQNARLAAKLTGWKIDIKSETQAAEQAEEIERMIREEIGFRELSETPEPVETAEGNGTTEAEEVLATENLPGEPQEEPMSPDEIEAESEEPFEPEPVETEPGTVPAVEEEEEEYAPKKKTKKSKNVPKHLERLELEEEAFPSPEDHYFFSDVLSKNQESASPEALETSETKSFKSEGEKQDESGFTGFSIGQLLQKELAKTGTAKKEPAKDGNKPRSAKERKKGGTVKKDED